MRIITESRLKAFAAEYPEAADWLRSFARVVKRVEWESIPDVRQLFPHADAVQAGSGKIFTVFNVKGNHYRLIVAIHYNRSLIYVRGFMPHSEYSKGYWKNLS